MYLPEELGEKAEKYLMNLRTDIYDILDEYDNDVRVQIYIFRNSHSFGTGSNCIVINITDSSIDMKVKINNRTQSQRETVIEDQSVVKWANTTKNVLKRMSSLNFL
jgi:UDP-N-acetylenolpyruvoylglucosamine reductase